METLIATLVITLVSAVICYRIAKSKNRSPQFWVVMAGFFGPFAIPFAYFTKPKEFER